MLLQPQTKDLQVLLHHVRLITPRQRLAVVTGAFLFLLLWLWRGVHTGHIAIPSYAYGNHAPSRPPSTFAELGNSTGLIPAKIWQILLPKGFTDEQSIESKQLEETTSWLAMNPDCAYTLINKEKGDAFVQRHFADRPDIVTMYKQLPNTGMKSDLLRYLILDVEGGVYTDIDTVALKPISKWVPSDLQDKVRLIVGIEFDRLDGSPWADISHEVQFAQWTIAAAPGHPVFPTMVSRVLRSVRLLSEEHGVPVHELTPGSFEVMNSTGPAAWTDVVFEQLQEYDPALRSTADLSFMTSPKLIGDILVLNIDGFGMGQGHSGATNDGSVPELALAKHLFKGSWRGDDR
jgi:alpha 1,6-mannosyltransferase